MDIFISNIQPSNIALSFIDRRINDVNYRGDKSSEHNRYDMEEIYNTLCLLNKYAPNKSLLQIRDTDLSKRPQNTSEEYDYAKFCEDVKEKVGKGTQDSIRKNIFVDIHRMGLIERYDKYKIPLNENSRGVKYVSLTSEGIKFISQKDILNRSFIFTKAVNNLLNGYIENSLTILKNIDYDIQSISKYEFMFFVSAIDSGTSFSISIDECVKLIKSYRLLSPIQRRSVVDKLSQLLKPENFSGNKTFKRDWHNWVNKITQVYHLCAQLPYFNVEKEEIMTLSTQKIRTKAGEIVDQRKRSLTEKQAYFKQHCVSRAPGFELHHVVPLCWADSPEQYKLFDKWENMVYIDAYRHSLITQNRNRNIIMTCKEKDIILSDVTGNQVLLSYVNKNILYSPSNQDIMLRYNKELRNTEGVM